VPANTPVFDPRDFQDLVDEAKRRIPQYCPEWTDHNVSDPGVTLIELFAWMVDILLYRLNQVPERDYLKFLDLIGARPKPAVPAIAELYFWLTAPQAASQVIPRGTEIATRQTETKAAVKFTTDADLRIRVPALKYWILSRAVDGGAKLEDVSVRLTWERAAQPVFQEAPKEGDTFYLGFEQNLAGHLVRLNVGCETLVAINILQEDPPITWEFWNGEDWAPLLPPPEDLDLLRQTEAECQQLGPRLDDTRGLNRNGRVILVIPRTCATRELVVGSRALEACWIRCRAARRNPQERFYDRSPVINQFRTESIGGMVLARQSFEVVDEALGRSDGTPAQSFGLLHAPILPRQADGDRPETIEVQRPDGVYETWIEVDQFSDSSPTDPHFMVDELSGEVRFGPRLREPGGEERQYGRVPPKGRQIHFTRYRSGGGTVGNVGRGTLVVPRSSTDLSYVKWVTNIRAATGGRDRETIEGFKLRGPKLVRTRQVAVTQSDYEFLAHEATPQAARVRCFAASADGRSDLPAPNHVRLLLVPAVPTRDEVIPREQLELRPEVRRELCRKVRAYLEERCPVTTELAVGLADYRWVSVRARLVIRARPDLEAVEREAIRRRVEDEANRTLCRFIHPVTGGPDDAGWPFGKSLTLGDVYPLLQGVGEVEYVDEVRFRSATFDPAGRIGLGPEERLLRLAATEVLCSAPHEIAVSEE
jgi:predicted phage baseplate assembly protein